MKPDQTKASLSYNELLILHELRKNSRISLAEISRKIDIPTSTVFDKINSLNKKLIKKHITIMDFPKMGYNIKVNYIIKAEKKDTLRNFLIDHKNVNTVYRTNNGSDFFVEGVFKNLKESQEFLESLTIFGIEKISEHFVVEELKRESFLTKKDHIGLIPHVFNDFPN